MSVLHDLPSTPQDTEPPPIRCSGCGKSYPWRWSEDWERWFVTEHDPCSGCQRVAELRERKQSWQRRLRTAGVPERFWPYSWGRVELSKPDEQVADFARRIRQQPAPTIGVVRGNGRTAAVCRVWKPEGYSLEGRAHRNTLWLEGGVGVGKSLYAAATMMGLLPEGELIETTQSEESLTQVYGRAMARRMAEMGRNTAFSRVGRTRTACWVTEAELVERESLRWKGDPAPLLRVVQAEVLVLDDLGMETDVSDKGWKIEVVQRLVNYRYDRGLPLIITSNLTLFGESDRSVAKRYGERVASRLREMCDRPHRVIGEDWRAM